MTFAGRANRREGEPTEEALTPISAATGVHLETNPAASTICNHGPTGQSGIKVAISLFLRAHGGVLRAAKPCFLMKRSCFL